MRKVKLADLLVARALTKDEEEARALILAGRVTVNGAVIDKPGTGVPAGAAVKLRGPRRRYASRAGEKLAAAFDAFDVEVAGRVCLDVGAAAGGFTSCLLERGARLVYGLDVGKGLLAWELRNDPRVVVLEGVNVRYFNGLGLEPAPTLLVADVSFISLEKALEKLLRETVDVTDCIVLVKPQFEAPRKDVDPGGVVSRPEVIRAAVGKVVRFMERVGFGAQGLLESPAPGPAGNREFLLWARRGAVTEVDVLA